MVAVIHKVLDGIGDMLIWGFFRITYNSGRGAYAIVYVDELDH